jgi:hypothetical protein
METVYIMGSKARFEVQIMGLEAVFNYCLADGWQVLATSWLLRISHLT